MYSLIRVWIGSKLARMQIQRQGRRQHDERQPTGRRRRACTGCRRPGSSRPSRRTGSPASRRQEADEQEQRDDPRQRARTPSADRARASAPAGCATTIAPTSGRNVMSVRIGRRRCPSSAARQHEVRAGHHDQPDGDAQRVVLDAAGLDPAQAAARRRRSTRPMPLTVPSTTSRSNHHRAAATRPPMTMNSRWLRSSNHHLLSEARYRNGTPGA